MQKRKAFEDDKKELLEERANTIELEKQKKM